MLTAMKENGSPGPEIETDDDRSYFLVRLPVHPQSASILTQTRPTAEVTAEVRKLLPLGVEPMERSALQRKMNLKHSENFRKSYLLPALQSDLLEMTIPDKPQSRLQKYRLTAKGRAWLDAQRRDVKTSR